MWPDEYIDWGRRVRSILVVQVRTQLERRLAPNEVLMGDCAEMAEQAAREAFEKAFDRRRYPGYFTSEPEFRVWLTTLAFREAWRLLLRHQDVEPYLNALPAAHRRLLGRVYLDHLPESDVAAMLGIPFPEFRNRREEALTTIFDLLRQTGSGLEP